MSAMQANRWTSAIAVIGLLLGLLVIWGRTAPGQAPAANPRVTWEYNILLRTDQGLLNDPFNKAGQDGWELVTIHRLPQSTEPNLCIFKRPKR
jgi:hypothetical protein